MDVFEIVGFIVMLLFLLAPLLRKIFGGKKKGAGQQKSPPSIRREASLAEEVQRYHRPEKVTPPPLEPIVEEEPHRLSTVRGRELPTSFEDYEGMEATGEASFIPQIKLGESMGEIATRYQEDSAYHQHTVGASQVSALLKRPGIGKEMVLLQEVISPPIALRKYMFTGVALP